jgi:hypothetical protein
VCEEVLKTLRSTNSGARLPGRLLNVSLMICKEIEAYLPLIPLFVESV